jgi:hypothetical protein
LGVLLGLPLACLQLGSSIEPSRTELAVAGMVLECPVGAEGCPCTPGGGCDPGLSCISGICSYGYDDASVGGEIVYEFEDDLAYPEPAPPPAKSESRGGGGRWRERAAERRADRQFGKNAAPAADMIAPGSTGTGSVMPVPEMVEPASPDQQSAPGLENLGRQVIYTAHLFVSVYGLDAAIEVAESIPERYGGWIDSRYDYQITLRVPAEHLFEVIEQLSALGVVLGKILQADDVTAEYMDLESRILILEHIVAQLELLLQRATTVEEALKIRVELDRMRIELESARARMRQLSEMIDFSTLTLTLSERGPEAVQTSNDPFPWVDELGLEATEYR